MKATEQYVPVVLFIILYKVVLNFRVCGWNPKRTDEMKATEQYFSAALFIISLAFLKVMHIEGWSGKPKYCFEIH